MEVERRESASLSLGEGRAGSPIEGSAFRSSWPPGHRKLLEVVGLLSSLLSSKFFPS